MYSTSLQSLASTWLTSSLLTPIYLDLHSMFPSLERDLRNKQKILRGDIIIKNKSFFTSQKNTGILFNFSRYFNEKFINTIIMKKQIFHKIMYDIRLLLFYVEVVDFLLSDLLILLQPWITFLRKILSLYCEQCSFVAWKIIFIQTFVNLELEIEIGKKIDSVDHK